MERGLSCKSASVDAAASFGFKDETAERPGTASQRLAEVPAHKPTAGGRLK